MTPNEINQALHEALGKYWFKHCPQENPDYCADPRLVIEAMREKGLLEEFLFYLSKEQYTSGVSINLIMDKSGKLALLGIEWLKEAKNE
jgi:hypothetical protein